MFIEEKLKQLRQEADPEKAQFDKESTEYARSVKEAKLGQRDEPLPKPKRTYRKTKLPVKQKVVLAKKAKPQLGTMGELSTSEQIALAEYQEGHTDPSLALAAKKKASTRGSSQVVSTRSWTHEQRVQALDLYTEGKTFPEISALTGRTVSDLRHYINTVQRSLTQQKQTRMLTMMTKKDGSPALTTPGNLKEMNYLRNPELINEAFFKLLSPPNSPDLTPEEERFCWAYVASLDLEEAMFAAGLDAGLYEVEKVAEDGRLSPVKGFQSCLRMRIAYLKTKKNLADFITKIRAEAVLSVEVGKDFLQKEIMLQIDSLKLSQTAESKKLIRDYLVMLGKTFGGFTEKFEITEIDHAETIKKLRDAAKEGGAARLVNEAARAKQALEEEEAMRREEDAGNCNQIH